jgi:hypothetical protein
MVCFEGATAGQERLYDDTMLERHGFVALFCSNSFDGRKSELMLGM